MKTKPETIDEYLAAFEQREARCAREASTSHSVRGAKAEECISYQIPAFRLGGKMLVAFGAARNHCAFYPGAHPVQAHQKELKAYDTSKGTIRFQADSPLPATLVRKLVKARIAEYAARP